MSHRALGPQFVFHATSYREDRDRMLREGVRMDNVPNNLGRQRYEAGEQSEYAPGAGVGRGTYVGGDAWRVTGYGRHLLGIEVHPEKELAVPPESTVPTRTVEHALRDNNGAMIVRDVPPERVHDLGVIHREAQPNSYYFEEAARQRAERDR